MSDPVTASTPPLVDVITEAILRELGSPLGVAENEGMLDDAVDAANSAADAALEALTKAGDVEWGVRVDQFTHSFPSDELARKAVGKFVGPNQCLVSRITGPWTAVDGE